MYYFLLFVLLLIAAFCFLVPIVFQFKLAYGEGTAGLRLEIGLGCGPARKVFDFSLPKKQEVWQRFNQNKLDGTLFPFWLRVAGRVAKQGRVARLNWRTVVGLDEASATAWALGLIWAGKSYLLSFLNGRYGLRIGAPEIQVVPSFFRQRFATSLDCIFKLRAGQIITASVHELLRRRSVA